MIQRRKAELAISQTVSYFGIQVLYIVRTVEAGDTCQRAVLAYSGASVRDSYQLRLL